MDDIGKFKRRQAILCNADGTVRAKTVWAVRVRSVGFAAPVRLALLNVGKKWECYDWISGALITSGMTRRQAIQTAIHILEGRGPARYAEAVQIVLDTMNNGKNLN